MSQTRRIWGKCQLSFPKEEMPAIHIVVINRQNVRDLCKRFSQMGLIKMTRIVMKICMGNILLMSSRPDSVFPSFLPTRGKPLLQGGNLLPQPVPVDLTPKAELAVKTAAFGVLLHNVFPHKANTTNTGSFIGTNV